MSVCVAIYLQGTKKPKTGENKIIKLILCVWPGLDIRFYMVLKVCILHVFPYSSIAPFNLHELH